jgi:hypothetical protein
MHIFAHVIIKCYIIPQGTWGHPPTCATDPMTLRHFPSEDPNEMGGATAPIEGVVAPRMPRLWV